MSNKYSRQSLSSNLEGRRPLFLLVGLSLALAAVFMAFELKFENEQPDFAVHYPVEEVDLSVVPITLTKLEHPTPPKQFAKTTLPDPSSFAIVANNVGLPDLTLSSLITEIDTAPVPIWDPGEDLGNEVYTFTNVERRPVFPGCEDLLTDEERFKCFGSSLLQFIGKEFEMPRSAKEFGVSEKLYVEFVIEKNGDVQQAKVLRGEDADLKQEALRVVRSLPRFQPGTISGKPVRMSYILPINVETK